MQPNSPTSKITSIPYPKCPNGNEARSICLSQQCHSYPFYCAICPEEQCQIKHLHGDKIASTAFREFMKKIHQYEQPRPELLEACETYKKSLQKLRQDVNKFIERELLEIQRVIKKSTEFPEREKTVVDLIVQKEYDKLQGWQMDQVWSCTNMEQGKDGKTSKLQAQINYLKIKNQEIIEISADFERVMKLLDTVQEEKGEQPTSIPEKSVKHSAIGLPKDKSVKSSKSPTPSPT